MVNLFLKEDADERIPLIQVFQHPWVLFFQHKFFADWQPNDSEESQEGETSSEENSYDDEDEDEEEEQEDDSEGSEESRVKATPTPTPKGDGINLGKQRK